MLLVGSAPQALSLSTDVDLLQPRHEAGAWSPGAVEQSLPLTRCSTL